MVIAPTEVEVILTYVLKREAEVSVFFRLRELAQRHNLTCRNSDPYDGLFMGAEDCGSYDWTFSGNIDNIRQFLSEL